MINLATGQLESWIAQIAWPFLRIGSCLMVAPAFAAVTVPARVRVVLAAAIALLVASLAPTPVAIAPFSAAGLVVAIQQIIVGVALGFCLQMIFDSVTLGGQLLANSMGLSFSFNVDPVRGTSTPALGDIYTLMVTLTFLSLNGHLRLLEVLTNSFSTLPIGTDGLGAEGLWHVAQWGSQLFSGALAIALPGVTSLLIVNIAFGVVSRASPSLNLFAVGFPVTLIFGLAILTAGLPTMQAGFVRLLESGFGMIQDLIGTRS